MHATIEQTLTAEERATAVHAIGAHFTEQIADAATRRRWALRRVLLAEAADWAADHALTEDRVRSILAHAPADERDVLERYLSGSRP